ncbi:hypothetical protein [uncultured Tenacibaculum sp.]|uniref:hypothetical protein n=1 Tax=uncultured Tenacibaculum sp. TaxID=174713 RepID=UPI0026245BC4|nr:hypothetical protein [uncultured Tenacibaculum sp.]
MIKKITLLCFFFILWNQIGNSQETPSYYIENKSSFLDIRLGTAVSEISKDRIEDFPFTLKDENKKLYYFLDTKKQRVAIIHSILKDQEIVSCIELATTNFSTEHGFNIGTTFEDIIKKFSPHEFKIRNNNTYGVIIRIDKLNYILDFPSDNDTVSIDEIPLTSMVISVRIQ